MGSRVLVTGGTGTLGREVVAKLAAAGTPYRVLSRRSGAEHVVGDLDTGAGLDEAVRDVGVVVHAATSGLRRRDAAGTRRLLDAIDRTGDRPHLVYVSIVGVDRVPMPYYREKVLVEELVAASGLPWTIQRATQFHDLLAMVFRGGARLPVLPVLAGTPFQPVDAGEVATRLVSLAGVDAVGRAPDLGGPQVAPMTELARTWMAARGIRRPVLPVRLPGGIGRGYRAGGHLAPEHADATVTFAEYAIRTAARATR